MAKKKDILKKSKSFYSLKSIHSKNSKGTIYENDYVTIVNNDDIYNEDIPLFSDSIFKFRIATSENNKKRHARSNWIKPDSGEEFWTKGDTSEGLISEESKIVLKPNYNSLKDFAYYGSAVELVKATINDIILRFPGGLYYYEDKYAPEIIVDNETYYLISNECQIDCWSPNITSIKEGENPLRYLSYSYEDYDGILVKPFINIKGNCIDSIIGELYINTYFKDNDNSQTSVFILSSFDDASELPLSNNKEGDCYFINDELHVWDGSEFINKGKIEYDVKLLIYKDNEGYNHLVTDENGEGVIIEPKKDIIEKFWDSLDDFERVLFNRESTPLYTAIFETPYEDETGYYYVPKMYTWPIVANSQTPDLTTSKFKGYVESLISLAEFHDEYDSDNIWRMMTHESIKNLDWTFNRDEDEMSDIDNGRMKAMIHIQGRLYDDIKRSIDNIKYNNIISYNEKNNVPDYFLSDIVENDGWEAKNILINPGNTPVIKYDKTIIYTEKDIENVNSIFLRRLALSSNYIQSMKGTRKGIEAILGMFGYYPYDGKKGEYEITEYIAKTEKKYEEFPTYDDLVCKRTEFDYVNADENTNFMQGYPVALMDDDNGTLIPWYDPNEKYVGDFYFQGKGGWKKMYSFTDSAGTVNYDKTYGETEPYMLFIDNLIALLEIPNDKLKDGMICYVADLGETTGYTHYFKLKDKLYSTILESGWTSASSEEERYMESLVQNYKGNNPHTGKGDYDMGDDYLKKYEHLFREAGGNYSGVGFGKITMLEDNDKCGVVVRRELLLCDDNEIEVQSEKESYQVINIKNMTIKFHTNDNESFKQYIKTTVMPYLEMMIPSTTIFEVLFDSEESCLDRIK